MTETSRVDIVVIGAGPAGSRTAARTAARGLRVLLLEKRARIGHPVRCAEAVGPREDVERYLTLDDSIVSSPVNGVLIVSPDGGRFELEMPGIGFTVDRTRFDGRLAEMAEAAGAELRTDQQVEGLVHENARVRGVRVRDLARGTEYAVSADVVVGADGIESLSPRWAGLKRHFLPDEIFSCAQELIEGIDVPGERIEFHLGRRFAPGGYAWVFPKGARRANVGVGINPLMAGRRTAADYLAAFIASRCPGGKCTRFVVGGCAVARGLPSLTADGYVTVGEAANQNNPFSGGGIINALEAADMAAEAIVGALGKGAPSAKALGAYTNAWKRSVGKTNEAFYHAARVFYGLTDEEMTRLTKELARVPGVFDSKGIRPAKMIRALVASQPRLLLRFIRSWSARRG
jgi:digeranylgeranylglycerophospholipid reductase